VILPASVIVSDTLCDMGVVEQLVGLLSQQHRPFHEQLIVALYHLITDNRRAQAECHRPEFGLKTLLTNRKRHLEGKEEFQVCSHWFTFLQWRCFSQMSFGICALLADYLQFIFSSYFVQLFFILSVFRFAGFQCSTCVLCNRHFTNFYWWWWWW